VKISLLSVGTEILLGDTVNTNLASLGQILYSNGYILNSEITVSDTRDDIKREFLKLLNENDVVITCGGIGPTEDDFTKDVIADCLNLNLVLDTDHLNWMKSRWESRGLEMPETNVKQAELPNGSEKLINKNGTAPGIKISTKENKTIFILPGPPREFIPLVEEEVIPFLSNQFNKTNKEYEFIIFYNQAESSLSEQITQFKPKNLDIAYLASKGVIKLRYDKNSVEKNELVLFLENINKNFHSDILSFENISPSKVLIDKLKDRKLSLSLVESITGGNLSSELIKYPGASSYLIASNILYTSQAKELFLGELLTDDWVSLTTKLADKSKKLYDTDISLAILGEAGPIPSSNYKIGEIFISINYEGKTTELTHNLRGSRQDIIERSVNNAIWDLLKII
jgi:nicotinamide-nucleotide amidase